MKKLPCALIPSQNTPVKIASGYFKRELKTLLHSTASLKINGHFNETSINPRVILFLHLLRGHVVHCKFAERIYICKGSAALSFAISGTSQRTAD